MVFYLPDFNSGILPETEAFHCIKVLRKGKGDTCKVVDGKGQSAMAKIEDPNPKKCLVSLQNIQKEEKGWKEQIYLAIAPTKQMERMEWMVEKCTEIGVDGFVFIHTARTERDVLKLDRLEKAAISAMKQSGQAWLPSFVWHEKWSKFPWSEFETIWLADLSKMAKDRIEIKPGKNLIFIGPEGDFTVNELEEISKNQAVSIRLRPQVLRTETAAIYALSMAHLG
jgi:16S rRNA (uracil1498-N3)-methyltransferase